MSRYTLPLNSRESSLHNAGGKGANLSILMRAGLNVPGGFIVNTRAYEDYVDHNRLRQTIQKELESHDLHDVGGLTEASKAIKERFSEGTLLHDLRDEMLESYNSMGRPPVAVRSSATAEDLPGLSFAGCRTRSSTSRGTTACLRPWSRAGAASGRPEPSGTGPETGFPSQASASP